MWENDDSRQIVQKEEPSKLTAASESLVKPGMTIMIGTFPSGIIAPFSWTPGFITSARIEKVKEPLSLNQ